jgi:hypothetical protein
MHLSQATIVVMNPHFTSYMMQRSGQAVSLAARSRRFESSINLARGKPKHTTWRWHSNPTHVNRPVNPQDEDQSPIPLEYKAPLPRTLP